MMTYSITEQVKSGFTLLELMIAIAIIGILAAIGVPAYNNYAIKARTSELLTAAAPYQLGVSEYAQTTGATSIASYPNAGTIPASTTSSNVKNIVISSAGVITVTGQPGTYAAGGTGGGSAFTTIILTPSVNTDGSIAWKCTSTCNGCAAGVSYAPATCQ